MGIDRKNMVGGEPEGGLPEWRSLRAGEFLVGRRNRVHGLTGELSEK